MNLRQQVRGGLKVLVGTRCARARWRAQSLLLEPCRAQPELFPLVPLRVWRLALILPSLLICETRLAARLDVGSLKSAGYGAVYLLAPP